MKIRKTLLTIVVGLLFFTSSNAQIAVNVNLGTPPAWAPADRVQTEYYYLPEINTYYDVPERRFIYIRNGGWVRSATLPANYRNYNLNKGKVIYLTDYRGRTPYIYNKNHKVKYVTTTYHPVYVKVKHDNGKHKGQYMKAQRHDNGKHKGEYKRGEKHDKNDHKGQSKQGNHKD